MAVFICHYIDLTQPNALFCDHDSKGNVNETEDKTTLIRSTK